VDFLPHLHFELRAVTNVDPKIRWYEKVWDQPFQASATGPIEFNKFGIFQTGGASPQDFYDIFQMFASNTLAFQTDGSTSTDTIEGLGLSLKNADKIMFPTTSPCLKTYRGAEFNNAVVPTATNGLRGFQGYGGRGAAILPVNGTPPSIYPTLTPSPVLLPPVQSP
jgi:hypothetical protein